jgi:hypothetical protein
MKQWAVRQAAGEVVHWGAIGNPPTACGLTGDVLRSPMQTDINCPACIKLNDHHPMDAAFNVGREQEMRDEIRSWKPVASTSGTIRGRTAQPARPWEVNRLFDPVYVDLCRRQPLDRSVREGDYFANLWDNFRQHEVKLASRDQTVQMHTFGAGNLPALKEAGGSVWLPRLDQLLDMLGEEGAHGVALVRCDEHPSCQRADLISPLVSHEGHGASREEATYRLLLEVRGA